MIGVELSIEGAPFVAEATQRGLLMNCTHDFTLRLLPPFIVTKAQVREFSASCLNRFSHRIQLQKRNLFPPRRNRNSSPRLARSAAR